MGRRKFFSFVVLILFCIGLLGAGRVTPAQTQNDLVSQLKQLTDGEAQIEYHQTTGKVRFIGTTPEHTIASDTANGLVNPSPEQAARGFLKQYGVLFGLTNPDEELTLMKERSAEDGSAMVRFQQVYRGIPVMGAELIVNLDANARALSAGGEILPEPKVELNPSFDPAAAMELALQMTAKQEGVPAESLQVSEPELWLYDPAIVGTPGLQRTRLVWRMEVTPLELAPIRELVLVDAQLGTLAMLYNQTDTALYRKIYDKNNALTSTLPGTLIRVEGQPPSGIDDVNQAYDYAGQTYNFYMTNHNRDSINGAGMQLISTTRYCQPGYACPYANAFWNGSQMVYGENYTQGNDVVAHEMTHGVTDYESHLFYFYQSGAINEALSDIWGEFVDQANQAAPADWLMGEDLPIGAIRSMSNPHAYNQPDRMGDALYYVCSSSDNGGVHTNSGVANKAAYLMTAGGSFNGQTVTALGRTKVAKIWYYVQTNLLTSASDYADLATYLNQSCLAQVGTNGITAADCQEVRDAIAATEMTNPPTYCAAIDASICTGTRSPVTAWYDDFENPAAFKWTKTSRWYYPQNSNPYGFDATYATSGIYNLWGYDYEAVSDNTVAMTNGVNIPALTGRNTPYLHFKHAYMFEGTNWDGGVVEYSVNGGAWTDAGSMFVNNGYTNTISSSYSNPLGGRQAFTADSYGYISSRLDLTSLAGQNVRFRFRLGTDSTGWDYGWFIDDVRIYACEEPMIVLSLYAYVGTPPPTPLPGSNTIVNGDFESGRVNWTEFSTHGWQLITTTLAAGVPPHGGSWAVWLGGDYNEVSTISQSVPIQAAGSVLSYYAYIASEETACGNDIGYVQVNGATVDSFNLCTTTNTGGWVKHTVDLSAYVGQTVTLLIGTNCDGLLNSNLFIDDVSTGNTLIPFEPEQPSNGFVPGSADPRR